MWWTSERERERHTLKSGGERVTKGVYMYKKKKKNRERVSRKSRLYGHNDHHDDDTTCLLCFLFYQDISHLLILTNHPTTHSTPIDNPRCVRCPMEIRKLSQLAPVQGRLGP